MTNIIQKKIDPTFVSADLGAGNGKLVINGECHSSRSFIYFRSYQDFVVELKRIPSDVIYYKEGSAKELRDKYWIIGEQSVRIRNLQPSVPTNDPTLKMDHALPLLLGMLSKALSPGNHNIYLIASHHDPSNLGADLVEKIEGVHQIIRDERTYNIQIKFPNKHKVIAEGSAIGEMDEEMSTIDIGDLTTTLIQHVNGELIEQSRTPFGVGHLVKKLCTHGGVSAKLGGVYAEHRNMSDALVEACDRDENSPLKKTILYRTEDRAPVDLTTEYKECMPAWAIEALSPAIKKLQSKEGLNYKVVAVGGGTRLPGLSKFFDKRRILIYAGDPIFANAMSAYNRYLKPIVENDKTIDVSFSSFFVELEKITNDEMSKRRKTRKSKDSEQSPNAAAL